MILFFELLIERLLTRAYELSKLIGNWIPRIGSFADEL